MNTLPNTLALGAEVFLIGSILMGWLAFIVVKRNRLTNTPENRMPRFVSALSAGFAIAFVTMLLHPDVSTVALMTLPGLWGLFSLLILATIATLRQKLFHNLAVVALTSLSLGGLIVIILIYTDNINNWANTLFARI